MSSFRISASFLLLFLPALAQAFVWETAPTFPVAGSVRALGAAVDVNGTLYALGGVPFDAQDKSTAHRLAPGANDWTVDNSLEEGVVHNGAGIDALGRIVVFGGLVLQNGDIGSNYVYDLIEGPQDGLPDRLGDPADSLFAFTSDLQGRVYSFGGGRGANASGGNPNLTDAQRFDAILDDWETIAPLPNGVADAGACRDGLGNILVIGGYGADGSARTAAVQTFDVGTGAWSLGAYPDMPVALSGHEAVLGADSRVYVIGGASAGGATQSAVYVLDPSSGTWSTGPSMAIPRRHFAAALRDDDHIYAMGGLNDGGGTDTVERLFTPTCPEFTQQPESGEPWEGQTLVLSTTVIGGSPLSYRWRRDGVDLADGPAPGGGVISGATSTTLTVTLFHAEDQGDYDLRASNDCGDTYSATAVIGMRTPPAFPAEWTGESLHSGGALASQARAIDGQQVVGYVAATDSTENAWHWNLETGDETDYHPIWDPPTPKSWANGVHGDMVVGFWWHPYRILHNGQWYVIYQPKACEWPNGPGSFAEVILGGGYEYTQLDAVDQTGAVGTAAWDDEVGNTFANAFWRPAAGGTVWLHPSGVSKSYGRAIDDGRQYGSINTPYPGPTTHAAMWSGTAASFVDLNPAGAYRSWIVAADDGQQVGSAEFAGVMKSLIWSNGAGGQVDLTPPGGLAATVYGVGGGLQVGAFNPGGGGHACVWRGDGESIMDLHDWLPPVFDSSTALDVDVDAEGVIRIVGHGYRGDLGRSEALLWTSGPSSTGVAAEQPDWSPARLTLSSWPNPATAGGTVSFSLRRSEMVSLEIFTPNGRRVKRIDGGALGVGTQSLRWDRVGKDGERLPAGIYFLRLRAGDEVATGKVVVLD